MNISKEENEVAQTWDVRGQFSGSLDANLPTLLETEN